MMDYPIERLDECIFDYLEENETMAQNLQQIYGGITSDYGIRCSQLTTGTNKIEINNNNCRFFTICYTLDTNFKNINKIFRNNTVYLLYDRELLPLDIYIYQPLDKTGDKIVFPQCSNDEELLTYIMNLIDSISPVMYNGSLMEFCINTNDINLLDELIDKYVTFDADECRRILKLALHKSDISMIDKIINLQSKSKLKDKSEFDEFENKFLDMHNILNRELQDQLNLEDKRSETIKMLKSNIATLELTHTQLTQEKSQLLGEISILKQLHKNAKRNLVGVSVFCICIVLGQVFTYLFI